MAVEILDQGRGLLQARGLGLEEGYLGNDNRNSTSGHGRMMRKVDVVRPPINYVVLSPTLGQIAWFTSPGDAEDFVRGQYDSERYEIAEVRR